MDRRQEIASIPLAIIGMGCRLPGADNLDEFWRLVLEGRCAVREIPPEILDRELYYDPRKGTLNKTYSTLAGLINRRPLDRSICALPEELERSVDVAHVRMCEVAAAALRHAGMDPFALPYRNTGVFIGHAQGSTLSGDCTFSMCLEEAAQFLREIDAFRALPADEQETLLREFLATIRAVLPLPTRDMPDVATSMIAGTIAKAFGLNGPFLALNSACASSLQAMLLGARALQLGRIDMAIAGGASDCKCDSLVLFAAAQSMSATGTRPFDADADGLICSEGYAAVVMKTLERALADGDRVLAVIRGFGVSADGRGKSLWAPRKEGQIVAMEEAYRAGLDIADLQYLEAHATATQVGDATELNAVAEVLAGRLPPGRKIPITSAKANLGHTLEAAGVAGLIKTVLCLQHRTIPPAANVTNLNPKIDWARAPVYVPLAPEPWPEPLPGKPRRAGVNAFGIGGLNMHVVVDEFTEDSKRLVRVPVAAPSAQTPAGTDVDGSPDANAVAVIGLGCMFAGAPNAAAYWDLLTSGRDPKSHATLDRWRPDLARLPGTQQPFQGTADLGGYITGFQYDWRAHKLPPKQIAQADPLQFMLLEAADEALRDAGYDRRPFERRRVGVVVGTEFGGDFAFQLQMALRLPHMNHVLAQLLTARGRPDLAQTLPKQFADRLLEHWPALIDESGSFSTSSLASRITKTWDLQGGAAAIDGGNASALTVLASGVDMLLAGDCQMVVCAAGQRRMSLLTYATLAQAGLLSAGTPRSPLDAQAGGLVPGEGVGVVLLKRLADARRDGDRIHAILRGIGVAHDAAPGCALQLAIERATQATHVQPGDVALMEVDTTGVTPLDQEQLRALGEVQRQAGRRQPLLLSSVVAQIGYTGGASGMAALLKAILELEHGQLPATPGFTQPAAPIAQSDGMLAVVTTLTPLQQATADGRQLAAVNSVNKGLTYHAILERPIKVAMQPTSTLSTPQATSRPATAAPRAAAPAVAAAPGAWRICRLGAPALEPLAAQAAAARAEALYAAAADARFTPADRARLAIVAESPAALADKLQLAARQLHDPGVRTVLEQRGIFARTLGSRAPRIAFVFPGQGSQYVGMLRQLAADVPAARQAIDEIDRTMRRRAFQTFAQMAWDEQTTAGADVWTTQASMLLADRVMLAVLDERGLRPDVVLGHSYGEYVALMAAGVWDFDQALEATHARCHAIEGSRATGAMLATSAPAEAIERLAAGLAGPVAVANYNAPDQHVVGGPRAAIEQLATQLQAQSYQAKVLAVPCPFHTSLMAPAAQMLADALAAARIEPARTPYKTAIALRYISDPDEIRANLAAHMTTPVRYEELIRSLVKESPTVLIEVGPQQTLTHLHRRILGDQGDMIAADNPKRPGVEQIWHVMALLEATGALGAKQVAAESRAMTPLPRTPVTPSAPRASGELLSFDATERRRDKMRKASESGRPAGSPAPRPPEPTPIPVVAAALAPKPPAPAAAPVAAPALADLETFLVKFVVEHTGYPAEVVELDADLEADLGIDSIKKAQLFGALREYFDVTPGENLTLDDFRTLRHVLNFLRGTPVATSVPASESAPTSAPVVAASVSASSAAPVSPPAPTVAAPVLADLETFLVKFVVEHTGYPAEVVELDADLEADLGIDSIKKAQLFGALREYFDVTPGENLTLDDFRTLRHVLNFLREAPGATSAPLSTPAVAPAPVVAASVPVSSAAPVSPPAPTVAAPALADLETFLVKFVVEHTGYPAEVVELDADLEADLGIDSIKKAQLFGALREYFDVTPGENLTLDDFRTLRHVLNFLQGTSPPASGSPPADTREPAVAAVGGNGFGEDPLAKKAEPQAAVAVLRLTGTPYEMGLEHGRQARAAIRAMLECYADVAGPELDDLPLPAGALADLNRRFTPDELDELSGIADGAEVALENLAAHNLVLLGELADCGHGVVGNGRAFHAWTGKLPLLAPLRERLAPQVQLRFPTRGVPHAVFGLAGMVVPLVGVNAAGVAITCAPSGDGARPQMPRPSAAALLAAAVDLPTAIDAARAARPATGWNACISHAASGQAVVLHADGAELRQRPAGSELVREALRDLSEACRERLLALERVLATGPQTAAMGEALEIALELAAQQADDREGRTPTPQPAEELTVVIDAAKGDAWLSPAQATAAPPKSVHVAVASLLSPDGWPVAPQPSFNAPRASAGFDPQQDAIPPETLTHRFVLRMIDAPPPEGFAGPAAPAWQGDVLVVGRNPDADALRRQIEASGGRVRDLPVDGELAQCLATLEGIWREQPAPYLFWMTGRDEPAGDLLDPQQWEPRRQLHVRWAYFVVQRWLQLAGEAGLLDRCLFGAGVRLGGDFGFSGRVVAPECGALTGLAKAVCFEYNFLRGAKNLRAKAFDAPDDEPPDVLAAAMLREFASGAIDYEVAVVGGRRRLQNAVPETAPVRPWADIRPGAVWVATGGARGITACLAQALGRRFGIRWHLIGTAPAPHIDPSWRNLSEEGRRELKAAVTLRARQSGAPIAEAWPRVEKALEIDHTLASFAAAGVAATYHTCDVRDRAALAQVLDEIRRSDGPIEGILHGAGIDRACRFEKKQADVVEATLGAKVDGAWNLVHLTRGDPLRHFIGLGSVSGRLGSNGQSDYCMASDMLCKLTGWIRTVRPGCQAVGFHWHPWDEIGMASRPETKAMLQMSNAPQFMPKREGPLHLLRELYAGVPRSEVLITDLDFHSRFYGPIAPATPAAAPATPETPPTSPQEPPVSAQEPTIAQRFVMRLVDAPLAGPADGMALGGPALILGDNADAQALAAALAAEGVLVRMLPPEDDPDRAVAAVEAAWTTHPAATFFLMTARDPEARSVHDGRAWNRFQRGYVAPCMAAQRWFRLAGKLPGAPERTLVAAVSLGGGFGFDRAPAAPEGGLFTGLIKSIRMEALRHNERGLRVKAIDAPVDEAPQTLAAAIVAELRAADPDVEVAWSAGRRRVVRSVAAPADSLPAVDVPRGGAWLVTGGARGITAETVLVLAERYGWKLHLLGTTPVPQPDAPWRNFSEEDLRQYKAALVKEALATGGSPEEHWLRVKSDLEIDRNLRRMAAAGVQATYHCCDVGDPDALDQLLQQIRATDGPIQGIVHGAGFGRQSRFETKPRKQIERTVRGKIQGAIALMALTARDPVQCFIGFGSLSGRSGGNGLSDYAAGNDMLAKLVGWYRAQRPDCRAVCVHWQTWDGVGMVTMGESMPIYRNTLAMEFISPAEGIGHLDRELRAGLPEAEVLITDGFYQRQFYPHEFAEAAATPAGTRRPLLETTASDRATIRFDPARDPFLVEHRLRGKPFLPGVVMLEALAETAATRQPGATVLELRNVTITNGLAFHSDAPIVAQVTARDTALGVQCRLTSELRDRKNRVIQAERVHAEGLVELGPERPRLDAPLPGNPAQGWLPHRYPNEGLLVHGQPLRTVRECYFQYDGAWSRIVAPPPGALAGARGAEGWILPLAVLDGCVVTCGSFVWVQFGGALEVPYGFDRLRLGRAPRPGETCVLRAYFRGREERHSRFDFTLCGDDQAVLVQAEGYRTILVGEGAL